MNANFLIVGHRGTRYEYDENTIQAFNKAIDFGANYIELDVRSTLDNKVIVMHDKSLERTTTGKGLINELTYNEISQYKTKKKFSNIPLLIEVLDEFKTKTKYIIEIKESGIYKEILELVQSKSLLESCIFSGRDLNELLLLKSTSPTSKICYNITKGKPLDLKKYINLSNKELKSIKPNLINLKAELVTPEFIQKCHNNDITALAWDFMNYEDPISVMQKLIKWGIDGILFDDFKNIKIIKKSI